jgi:hypothetical protein
MEIGQNKVFIAVLLLLLIGIIVAVGLTVTGGYGDSNSGNIDNSIASSSIVGNFENKISVSAINFKSHIEEASTKLSNIIEDFNVIPITYKIDDNPGGNVLAYAYMNNPNDIYAGGTVVLGNVKIYSLSWSEIIVHELLHVLGVGSSTKWDNNIIVDSNGHTFLNRNIFVNAGEAYDELIDQGKITGTKGNNIPLSDKHDSFDDGSSHLDEGIFDQEISTPIADRNMIISNLTIQILKDLGFAVDNSYAEEL